MYIVRQRILLFTGWLFMAVVAGLVASGAVAVAGGQVLERPLRPLTAAEVAALPFAPVDSTDPIDPHASGGIEGTTGGSTDGSASGTQFEPGTIDDSLPEETVLGDDPVVDVEPSAPDRFTRPDDSEFALVKIPSGKASIVLADESLHLLWVTPAAGYVMHVVESNEESIIIQLSSNRDVWLIEASIADGALLVTSHEAPIT